MTVTEIANQLIQSINIDSLPTVSLLKEQNLHRVFGGSVSDQIMLLYKESISLEKLKVIQSVFNQAAEYNRNQQLKYQRAIFCQTNEQYFEGQFNQQPSKLFKQAYQDGTDYAIIFIKTDYDRFNLKKFVLKQTQKQLTSQDIIQFIEDVRMRRIQPQYKSEQIPPQDQNTGILRKIVSDNFVSEVYGKKGQSTIVLFIDSKDKSSYRQVKKTLQDFVTKYKNQFENKVNFGIFDLAKNEHKLLYLKQAPQLILFDVSNKKQTKFFKLVNEATIQNLEEWVRKEVSNVQINKIQELL